MKIASEFRSPDLPFEDLLNEGNLGLIEAARRFDHNRGTRFLTYAVWWIRRSILRALSRHSDLVRISSYQMKKVRQVRATERVLAKELGRKPDREEISRVLQSTIRTLTLSELGKRLGITGERVRQIESQARKRMRKLISRNWATTSTPKHHPGGHPASA